tara:strand:- start:818 stop:1030 length:213 start_codon:yes stop_codon:yes gene_type:complete
MVEKQNQLGGTWRINNHYPNLIANNARDTFTLPDLPPLPDTDDFPTINTLYSEIKDEYRSNIKLPLFYYG